MPVVYLLDYVAGNIRSLVNAIEKLGYTVEWIRSPEDVARADVRMQPGSGSIDAITFISKYLASFC
jgi:glutamine amidotransferase/cyclase